MVREVRKPEVLKNKLQLINKQKKTCEVEVITNYCKPVLLR